MDNIVCHWPQYACPFISNQPEFIFLPINWDLNVSILFIHHFFLSTVSCHYSKDGWDPKPLNYTLNKCFSVHNRVKNDIFIVKLDVIRKDWFFYYFKVCLHFVDYLKRKHISNFKSNSFLSMNILIKRFKEIILYFQIQDLLFS